MNEPIHATQPRRCIWCGHTEHQPEGCEACHPAPAHQPQHHEQTDAEEQPA